MTNVRGMHTVRVKYTIAMKFPQFSGFNQRHKINHIMANQGIAARSKASVNIHPTLCAGVGSTPADDAGQTCWTSCGKVAIFCNLYAYGGMQTTVGMSKRVNSRDNSAHISRDPTIKVTKVQKE